MDSQALRRVRFRAPTGGDDGLEPGALQLLKGIENRETCAIVRARLPGDLLGKLGGLNEITLFCSRLRHLISYFLS